MVDDFGFDACVGYRASDFLAQLDRACPDGIGVKYENVGGAEMGAVYERMNIAGRMVLCGMVSEFPLPMRSETGRAYGPSSLNRKGSKASVPRAICT